MTYRKPPVKLAIVDDHKLFRKGLISLINMSRDKYVILFEAENGKDMMNKLEKKNLPDIIIMDMDMPGGDGFQTMTWLKQYHKEIPVLVVSMVMTEDAIVRMLRMGVKGYLSKDIEPHDIHNALEAIATKGFYYTDFITGQLILSLQSEFTANDLDDTTAAAKKIWNELTEREKEFVGNVCSEMTYVQIAEEMNLSPKTIDGYRDALFKKFKVKNRVGIVLYAIKNGFVKV